MFSLENIATLSGLFDGDDLKLESNVSTVRVISGITAVKSADKTVWVDGYLNYTVTLTNESLEPFLLPTFVDEIDTVLSKLVEGSVKVNGVSVPYTYENGVLTVVLSTVAHGTVVTIEFTVERA